MRNNRKRLTRHSSTTTIQRSSGSIQEQSISSYTYLHLLAGLTFSGLILIIIYYYFRKSSLMNRHDIEKVSFINTPSNFFSPASEVSKYFNQEIQKNWVESIRFKTHSDFSKAYIKENEKSQQLKQEIDLQKKLLLTLNLTLANQVALSEGVIKLVPETVIPSGMVDYKTGELWFAMLDFITPKERRQTLLNEIHHLTIGHVNKLKLENNIKISNKQLYYPFLDEHGMIDSDLKNKLQRALMQLEETIDDLDMLLKKIFTNPNEQNRLNKYLKAISEYQPQTMRVTFNKAEFDHMIKNGAIKKISDTKLKLKLPTGEFVYGNLHANYEGKVIIIYSLNKDLSAKELARTFIEDYRYKNLILKVVYPLEYKNRGEKFDEIDLLKEQASDLDELLTPKMKQVFAPKFKKYFDTYCELNPTLVAHHIYSK